MDIMNYTYVFCYDPMTLTTGVYNIYGELQSPDVEPVVDCMTLEEAEQKVRVERNHRLFACDWTQLPDTPLSPQQIESWKVYRQALRDLPNKLVWNQSKWPIEPS